MPLKILLVDDEPAVLKVITAITEPMGWEVQGFADSRVAAERVKSERFDAAFLDARMPHVDGIELARRIRASKLNHTVPIVMITGADDLQIMRESFQAGVTFYLAKPFTPECAARIFNALRAGILADRRHHLRLPLRTTVDCQFGTKRFKSFSINLSEGGLLVEPSGGLAPGNEVDLEFALPEVAHRLRLHAKVVRKEPPDRIGVEFLGVSPKDREALQHYLGAIIKL